MILNNVTYADVTFVKDDTGRLYAGVEMYHKIDDKYVPYFVISYAAGVNIPSIKRLVPILLRYTLRYVDRSHDVVIFRSYSKTFQCSTKYEQEVSMGQNRTIKLVYVPRRLFLRNHSIHSILLANDAIDRGLTVESSVAI